MTKDKATLIEVGKWEWGDEGIDWELYRSSILPEPSSCTAAFCVAITKNGKILLEREVRGWGMIGGHIEDGETIEEALVRECLEEGGFGVKEPTLFGYKKIIASKPVPHPTPGMEYPFPISYNAYYYAESQDEIIPPSEPEVLEVGEFTLEEVKQLDTNDYTTVQLGWNAYRTGK